MTAPSVRCGSSFVCSPPPTVNFLVPINILLYQRSSRWATLVINTVSAPKPDRVSSLMAASNWRRSSVGRYKPGACWFCLRARGSLSTAIYCVQLICFGRTHTCTGASASFSGGMRARCHSEKIGTHFRCTPPRAILPREIVCVYKNEPGILDFNESTRPRPHVSSACFSLPTALMYSDFD